MSHPPASTPAATLPSAPSSNLITPATAEAFEIVVTADGSYTARIGLGETMHSMRGALGETIYIYGSAFERMHSARCASTQQAPQQAPQILSLGLGLGFVELVAAAVAIKFDAPLCGESFEADSRLLMSFENWVNGGTEIAGHIPCFVYEKALEMTALAYGLDPKAILAKLRQGLSAGTWRLSGPLLATTFSDQTGDDGAAKQRRFNAVAFDAFSSKSTPELWTREFLDPFLSLACSPDCILSTYACTGHLKRALVDAGFTLEIREGFASKRDSTLAWRSKLTAI